MIRMPSVRPGRYRHYKGNEYTVVGVARHSETLEDMVVYRPEYGERALWVRPESMFLESVTIDGRQAPRFQLLDSTPDECSSHRENVFADLPTHLPTELIQTLLTAADVHIERIVSHGHATPTDFWFDQDQAEWVVVLAGAARLRFEAGDPIEMLAGDFVNIPPHAKHRVDWTTPDEPTIWLAMHYGERK